MRELTESNLRVGLLRRRPRLEELIPLVDTQEIILKGEPREDWMLSPWMWQLTSSTQALNDASAKMSQEAGMKQMASEVAKEFQLDLGLLQSRNIAESRSGRASKCENVGRRVAAGQRCR